MASRYCTDGAVGQFAPSPFYGCYLLLSKNPRYRGYTYIGFTVDPQRRLKQHNGGKDKGGAWRTSGRGPWELVCMVYGFMDEISALQFEWAWQNPESTRRLRSLPKEVRTRNKGATAVENRVRTVAALLSVGPFCRLPLTLHWISEELRTKCMRWTEKLPALVRVRNGPISVRPKPRAQGVSPAAEPPKQCAVCNRQLEISTPALRCYADGCDAASHVRCLGTYFLESAGCSDNCLPVGGRCPACNTRVLWGELVRPLTAPGMPYNCSARRKPHRRRGADGDRSDDAECMDDGDKPPAPMQQHSDDEFEGVGMSITDDDDDGYSCADDPGEGRVGEWEEFDLT